MSDSSPLSEAQVTSLDEYFARKPPYDVETLEALKREFRRQREQWLKAGLDAPQPRAKKVKPTKSTVVDIDLFGEGGSS